MSVSSNKYEMKPFMKFIPKESVIEIYSPKDHQSIDSMLNDAKREVPELFSVNNLPDSKFNSEGQAIIYMDNSDIILYHITEEKIMPLYRYLVPQDTMIDYNSGNTDITSYEDFFKDKKRIIVFYNNTANLLDNSYHTQVLQIAENLKITNFNAKKLNDNIYNNAMFSLRQRLFSHKG